MAVIPKQSPSKRKPSHGDSIPAGRCTGFSGAAAAIADPAAGDHAITVAHDCAGHASAAGAGTRRQWPAGAERRVPLPAIIGARFEGTVTQEGLVRSGATGTLPVTVTANVAGYAPVVERVEVVMVPAAAGRIEIEPPTKLLVGQQIQLLGKVYSIHGEPRTDAISWRASSPIATVTDGRLTAVRPGKVTITGTAGSEPRALMSTLPRATLAGSRSRLRQALRGLAMSFGSSWTHATATTRAIAGSRRRGASRPARA